MTSQATRPKILIVDDEPFNVDYLEQELEDLQYETVSAANGQEALEKVHSESPDLVLLDIMMPVMDGFEVLGKLKAQPVTRDLPVIVISASNDLPSVVRGIKLGAEDYLPKPFEPVLLRARIAASLEKKRMSDMQQRYLQSIERELDIGREIQMGFLPSDLPQVPGLEIAAYFKAAREVAGDFYDAFVLPDGKLMCVIGDVCGKGVGAALFMTLFRSLIRATATTDYFFNEKVQQARTAPERIQHVVSFTNRYIAETHGDANMFATVFIGIIDTQGGLLTYVNCGNEPPFLIGKADTVATLRPTGPVLGINPEAGFVVKEISMNKNDALIIFTDGITDAFNDEAVSFGHERLLNSLGNGSAAPGAMLDNVVRDLGRFVGAVDQFDDITLLVVKRGS